MVLGRFRLTIGFLCSFALSCWTWVAAQGTEDCKDSQACLYERANDLLVLQANYLFAKANEVAQQQKSSAGFVYRELGKFCETGSEAQGTAPRKLKRLSEKECLENYLLLARKGLRSIRTAIARNEDVVQKLGATSMPVMKSRGALPAREAGVSEVPNAPRSELEGLRRDEPFLPDLTVMDPILKKLDDLQRTKSLTRAGRQQMDQELLDWWESFPKCPAPDEFIQVEAVERFPSNPTGEKLRRVKLKPDGKVAHDERAFAEAMKECQSKRADWLKSGPVASPPLESAPAWLAKAPSDLSLQLFEKAQQRLADCASGKSNEGTKKTGPVVLCGALPTGAGQKFRSLQLSDAEFQKADRELQKLQKTELSE